MYVDKLASGRGRVSWALFAGAGSTMVGRNITITWGPAGGGQFWDLSPMGSLSYSNSRQIYGSGRFSASIQGSVTMVGKYLSCSIPRHQTNTVTL
ncbi:hypothetical protein [Frondihabitans sp. 762G35]|uniref:hypothetical protein n=1 Tax=Frondihabitans sp. 762G35 TaxID=1446794 RepID=UPI000F50833C|nr:hypothetical protein [Frondihabitans sp. 762G35]